MQLANCNVRLGGDLNNEVFKAQVTPPEILLLKAIHGADAVVKVQPTGMDKRQHHAEFDRLKKEYGEKLVLGVFPGASPNLPVHLKDIGIDAYSEKPARSKRSAEPEDAGADAGE